MINLKLKNKRKNKGLSQSQIAKLSQISERQYRRIELSEQTPNVDTAIIIAKILNTTVEELFE